MDNGKQPQPNWEIVFEVGEDIYDGGYFASAIGFGIHTQGDTVEELRCNINEAVECHFDDADDRPKLVRLHFVRDEALAV